MYRKVEDLLKEYEREFHSTQKLIDGLTDASLSTEVAKGYRTLGRIAWHIVTTIPEMMGKAGLAVAAVRDDAPVPHKAAEIQKAYAAATGELLEQVRANWNDQTLMIMDEMYGEQWPRGMTARVLIDHQSHHRGQMTVLMRQAGLLVSGVCGPTKEDWAGFGAPPPEV